MEANELLLKWMNNNLTEAEEQRLYATYDRAQLEQFRSMTDGLSIDTVAPNVAWERFVQEGRLHKKTTNGLKSRSTKMIWYALLTTFVVAGLAYWFLYSGSITTIKNDTSEPLLFALIDDTQVQLAPGSAITYDKGSYASNRHINLQGHAYFDVQKKGPFQVDAGKVTVSVLGTTFDVWTISDTHSQVQCYTGKVIVDIGEKSQIIATGQEANISNSKISIDIVADTIPSWISDGLVSFDKVPLHDVYLQLEQLYSVTFIGKKARTKYTGSLPIDNLQKALDILSAVTSDTYQQNDYKVQITSD